MIVYVDPSLLSRAYFEDEPGHASAVELLNDREIGLITGTWTRIEVSGAIVGAARGGRADPDGLLDLLDWDTGDGGRVAVVQAHQGKVEERALALVRAHGLRAMDAWHLAVALLVLPDLLEPGERGGFATGDSDQARVAELSGLATHWRSEG